MKNKTLFAMVIAAIICILMVAVIPIFLPRLYLFFQLFAIATLAIVALGVTIYELVKKEFFNKKIYWGVLLLIAVFLFAWNMPFRSIAKAHLGLANEEYSSVAEQTVAAIKQEKDGWGYYEDCPKSWKTNNPYGLLYKKQGD